MVDVKRLAVVGAILSTRTTEEGKPVNFNGWWWGLGSLGLVGPVAMAAGGRGITRPTATPHKQKQDTLIYKDRSEERGAGFQKQRDLTSTRRERGAAAFPSRRLIAGESASNAGGEIL